MRNRTKIIIFVFLILFIAHTCAFAKSMQIKDLINNDTKLDGKKVTVEGEAIGHLMQRGGSAWLNINDNTECIGIWDDDNLFSRIKYLGKHTVTGDWVRVDGIFNVRCPMHGGDTDMHADSLVVLKRGGLRILDYDQKKINILVFLIGVLACLYIIKILKRLQ